MEVYRFVICFYVNYATKKKLLEYTKRLKKLQLTIVINIVKNMFPKVKI